MTVLFLHIPKTAGSSIYSILENQYPAARSFKLEAGKIPAAIKKFKNLPGEKKSQLQLVYGHMGFGLHNHIPGKAQYFTLLRDAVDRVISHYYYVLRRPRHYLHDKIVKGNMDLKAYVSRSVSNELNNGQARLISGVGPNFNIDRCPQSLLDQARKNLEDYFVLAGLTEFFDETILMLKDLFNWKVPVYFKEKITPNRPDKEDLDKETLETIKKYNRLDIDLYQQARQKFVEKLELLGQPFQAKLKAFRLLNLLWRQQFIKVTKFRNTKIPTRFSSAVVKKIIKQHEELMSGKDIETASWLIQYALEIYPKDKALQKLLHY